MKDPWVSVFLIPHAKWERVVYVIKFILPCKPSDEASGISANDEFSNLVQTASKKRKKNPHQKRYEQGVTMWVYLHNQCQSERHGYEEVFRGDGTRLEDVMAGKHTNQRLSTSGKLFDEKDDVQDGYVAEENAYKQRTDRGGYHGTVHAPRRWLLEDTWPSRARREQVTTNYLSSPGNKRERKVMAHPHCITTSVKKYTLWAS
jgi:hypothetical protein